MTVDARYILCEPHSAHPNALILGSGAVISGTAALRPQAGVPGRLYFATDTAGGTLYRDSGSSWIQISLGLTDTLLNTLADAKGDIIAATGADVWARVAIGTDGQVLTADTASTPGLKWATPSSGVTVLDRDVTEQTITANTETSVYSYSVPGNTMGSTKTLCIAMQWLILNNGGANRVYTVRVSFGGTVVHFSALTQNIDADDKLALTEVWITNVNATNTQRCYGRTTWPPAAGHAAGSVGNPPTVDELVTTRYSGNATLAIDTTAAQTVAVTLQHEGNDASVTCQSVLLELL